MEAQEGRVVPDDGGYASRTAIAPNTTETNTATLEPNARAGKYVVSDRQAADIANRFTYHTPKSDQLERYKRIRAEALTFAMTIAECSPSSREQSVALTCLDEVVMNANAAIARHES